MRSLGFLLAVVLFSSVARADLIGLDGQPIPQDASVIAQLEAARELLASSKLEECRTKLRDLAKSQSNLPHPDVTISNWLLDFGYPKQARQLMEQLSVDSPARMDIQFWFARLAAAEGRLFDASSHLQLIHHLAPPENWSPDYRDAFLASVQRLRARVAALRGEWQAASTMLNGLLAGGIEDANIRLGLGQALFAQQDLRGAELQLRKASDLAPDSVVPELVLAELHDGIGNIEESEKWFRQLLARAETNKLSESTTQRAVAAYASWLLKRNRPNDTLNTIRVLSDAEEIPEFRLLGAFAQQMNGEYETAAKILAELSQNDPGNVLLGNRLALALVESDDEGKRGRALQIAQANIKLAPRSVNVACSLAWIQFRLGDLSAASRTASAVLKAGGQLDRDSAYFLAEILHAMGRTQEASRLMDLATTGTSEFYYQKPLQQRRNPVSEASPTASKG